jgi:hypothetical protein
VTGRRYCPVAQRSADCQTTIHSSSSSSDPVCHLSRFNETNTICICNLSKIRTVVGDSGTVSFSLLSIGKSVWVDFVSTWKTTTTLSSSQVLESWIVLVTIGSVGVLFVVCVLVGMRCDAWERRNFLSKSAKLSESQQRKSLLITQVTNLNAVSASSSLSSSESHRPPSPVSAVSPKEDLKLIDQSLPSIFNQDPVWKKFMNEMKVYHRWLGIVFYYSPVFPRAMRVLSLFTSIVIMLFVQSVVYNIADSNDGSCEKCHDEHCCLSYQSTLNRNEKKCYWEVTASANATSAAEGNCFFRNVGSDMTRMFIVAMISAVVSAPFALSIQYLIGNFLSKETVESSNSATPTTSAVVSVKQRRTKVGSNQSLSLVERCGRSLQEDLNNLLRELSKYYQDHLSQWDEKEREEFKGIGPPSLLSSIFSPLLISFSLSFFFWLL